MPHLVIDYSNDLEEQINPRELVDQIYLSAVNSGLFNEKDIKVRALPFTYYKNGQNDKNFVNVTIHLLSGRSIQQKKNLTNQVLDSLKTLNIVDSILTVQIYDIITEPYAKSEPV